MASIARRRSCVKKQKLATIVPIGPRRFARPAQRLHTPAPQPGLIIFLLSIVVLRLFNQPLMSYFPNSQLSTQDHRWSHSLYLIALDWSLAHGYHAVRWEVVGC